jgi:hypothetical protein
MAYTKYSLTPANNTAAPPDGAPEGMLPSAVNDTMRDMMAQIRDVGDGVRDGTYTMTAVKITGGTINGATIGATTATTGAFTTINASTSITNAGLTSGRVTYAGASGLLTDSANLKFDGNNLGIGTTPAYDLQVSKSVSSGSVITQINNPSATGSAEAATVLNVMDFEAVAEPLVTTSEIVSATVSPTFTQAHPQSVKKSAEDSA